MERFSGSKGILSPFMTGLTQILDWRANFAGRQDGDAGWERDVAAFRADWVAIEQDMKAAFGAAAPDWESRSG